MRDLKIHTDNQLILSKEIYLVKIIFVFLVALTVSVVMNKFVPKNLHKNNPKGKLFFETAGYLGLKTNVYL